MKRSILIILILKLYFPLYSQGGLSAVPFLSLQQSPLLQSAGQIGAAIPSNDALGFYFNPANLGYSSKENQTSYFMMPDKAKWLRYYGISLNTYGFNLGYNFEKKDSTLPISVGLGFIHNIIKYGGVSEDYFNCFSIGASFNYLLLFNLGFSIKPFNSKLSIDPVTNKSYEASGTAYDFGFLVIAPVSELFFTNIKYAIDENLFIKPSFTFSTGTSITNIGKEIYYVSPSQSDPIPRTARLGYNFSLGFDLLYNQYKLSLFNYSFTAEAEDILIKTDASSHFRYQGYLNDLKFGENLVALKGDQKILVHKGHIFRLFETIIITSGRINGGGYNRKSNGIGVSSEGIFKSLSMIIQNPLLNFFTNHFTFEYYNTNIFTDTNNESNFNGLAFYLKNISF